MIKTRAASFGGACSIYHGGANCPGNGVENGNAKSIPVPTVIRRGIMTRVCSETLSIDRSISNVLGQVGVNINDTASIQKIQKLFNIYNPGRDYNDAVIDGLLELFQKARERGLSNKDAWGLANYALCLAPTFELL